MFPPSTQVLVVDDMRGVRILLHKLLRELGFQNIAEAEHGKQAQQMIVDAQKAGKPFGLIIADWRMPEMDGLELLKYIRASDELKNLPYILLTAESEKTNVMEAAKHGVSEYIVKPTSAPILSKKIASAWEVHYGKK